MRSGQLTQYRCTICGSILKETDLEIPNITSISEECPSCGSSLLHNIRMTLKSNLAPPQPLPKLQTAYDINARVTFDIQRIDRLISLSVKDRVCITGNNRYANLLLTRLWIRALLPKRHGGLEAQSAIAIDAGNCTDLYRFVKFARQYYMDIREALRSIWISRAFTIHQVAGLIIQMLPKIVKQFNPKLVSISDLSKMFIEDPQIEHREVSYLINEIARAIRKLSNDILVILTLHNTSSKYDRLILPLFNKRIEITNSSSRELLTVRVYDQHRILGQTSMHDSDLYLVSSV